METLPERGRLNLTLFLSAAALFGGCKVAPAVMQLNSAPCAQPCPLQPARKERYASATLCDSRTRRAHERGRRGEGQRGGSFGARVGNAHTDSQGLAAVAAARLAVHALRLRCSLI